MKKIITIVVCAIMLIGCSTTYRVNEIDGKEGCYSVVKHKENKGTIWTKVLCEEDAAG